jgi:hypothetical protein
MPPVTGVDPAFSTFLGMRPAGIRLSKMDPVDDRRRDADFGPLLPHPRYPSGLADLHAEPADLSYLNLLTPATQLLISPTRLCLFARPGCQSERSEAYQRHGPGQAGMEDKCRPRRAQPGARIGGLLGGLGALCFCGKSWTGTRWSPSQGLNSSSQPNWRAKEWDASCASGSPSRGSRRVVSKVEIVDNDFRRRC